MGQNIPAKMVNITHNLTLYHYLVFGYISLICYSYFSLYCPKVNNLLEPKSQERTEQSADITNLRRNNVKQYPEKLIGYEALLDDHSDLDMAEPVGK